MDKSKPYRAYDLITGAELGRYDHYYEGHEAHPDKAVEVIYRPSKKKAARKEFPYNG